MIQHTIIAATLFSKLSFGAIDMPFEPKYTALASEQMSLETRQINPYMNSVNKDNILLTVAYMQGRVHNKSDINWDEIRRPYRSEFRLNPGEVFAYQEDVLPEFQGSVVKTTNAHFNGAEGFKNDGYLMGNGVCHFASLMNWTAQNAGLEVVAPTNHNFYKIEGIDRIYGTSIYSMPGNPSANARQNLYIKNNQEKPVVFVFEYDGENLRTSINRENS